MAQSFVTGFNNIENRGISPPYLSEFGLEKLNDIISLLNKNGVKQFVATNVDSHRAVNITERAARTLRELLPPKRAVDSSIEGRLETISVHGQKKFIVYHSITSKAVTCKIADDVHLDTAKRALGYKVYVSGIVTINVKNEPLSVDVSELRVLGADKRIPLASELTGSDPDFTGALSTDEYIRSIRRG